MRAPYGIDRPQAHQLPPWEAAQGRPEEALQGQLCHCCCCSHLGRQPPVCRPHGRHGQSGPKRMMARAGMHLLSVSRMHGRTIGHRARNFNSPFTPHHSHRDPPPRLPHPFRRPHVALHLGQDTPQDVSMPLPGASLRCSSQENQVFQETKEENH